MDTNLTDIMIPIDETLDHKALTDIRDAIIGQGGRSAAPPSNGVYRIKDSFAYGSIRRRVEMFTRK